MPRRTCDPARRRRSSQNPDRACVAPGEPRLTVWIQSRISGTVDSQVTLVTWVRAVDTDLVRIISLDSLSSSHGRY